MIAGLAACTSQPELVVHTLDRKVWKDPRPINWPGDEKAVFVYFNVDGGFSICNRILTSEARSSLAAESKILFGSACGRLLVLIAPVPLPPGEETREMAAAHEAFHLAVQVRTLLPRLDRAFSAGVPADRALANVRRYAIDIIEPLLSTRASNKLVCARLQSGYSKLTAEEREYFSYRSYWEWPAEFYMRETSLAKASFAVYREARRKLAGEREEDVIYVAGAAAIERMERYTAREVWQREYMNGESMLNLIAKSLGCAKFHPPSIQATSVRDEEIFMDAPSNPVDRLRELPHR